ncbi:hypothetical protein S40293_09768 [Stachybotrys chartarum IBT 40293]|nr:hypothetical protein S40293_09768 [Stachybotrys chartarum IBT 40293]
MASGCLESDHHSTDKTISSIEFSNSEGRMPVMRTSSTSDKLRQKHVKRVRFIICEAEVLPTSSPPTSSRPKPQTFSVESHEIEGRPLPDVLREDNAEEAVRTSQAEVDMESMVSRAKKRPSSTEALRSLSSKPLEGEWITINPSEIPGDTLEDADETEPSDAGRLLKESPSMNSGLSDALTPNLEVEDCNIFLMETEKPESGARFGKYPLEEDQDEDKEIEVLASNNHGVPIPCSMKATSSMFIRPLGSYEGAPFHSTPFNGQRLHCGVPAKASDTYASSFSERLAREEQWMGDMDETAQDFDLASMALEISHEFAMSHGSLVDRQYSKPSATHR